MSDPNVARHYHAYVISCPCCGRRVRASQLVRAWESNPKATFSDAEAMFTRSSGPRKLRNERHPLWDYAAGRQWDEKYKLRRRLDAFFTAVDRRLTAAAMEARSAASRARIL